MSIEKERKAFEVFVNNPLMTLKNLDPTSSKTYQEPITEFAWKAWQASVNRQGYKLAPIEPTQKMISAGMGVFSFPLDNGRFSDCELIFSYREMIGACDD